MIKSKELRERKRAESKAFKQMVEKRNLQARRQSYAEESRKVAEEKGKAIARKKSFREIVSERASGYARARVSGQKPVRIVRRTTPIRRTPVRRVVRRTVRRTVPYRRTTTRRYVVKKGIRRSPTTPIRQEAKPFNIGDLL